GTDLVPVGAIAKGVQGDTLRALDKIVKNRRGHRHRVLPRRRWRAHRMLLQRQQFKRFGMIEVRRVHARPSVSAARLGAYSGYQHGTCFNQRGVTRARFPMRKGVHLLGVWLSSLCVDATDLDTRMTLAL